MGVEIICQKIKKMQSSKFTFKDAKLARSKPSRRLQALEGKKFIDELQPTAESQYRITVYYRTLDEVFHEMMSRFQSNDQEILSALASVVKNLTFVSSFFTLDAEIFKAEKTISQNFMAKGTSEVKNAAVIVQKMYAVIVQKMYDNGVLPSDF